MAEAYPVTQDSRFIEARALLSKQKYEDAITLIISLLTSV